MKILKCCVKECNNEAVCKVEKIVSRLSQMQEDYLIRVYVPICGEHGRQLSFAKRELILPLESEIR